jgi:hypothetical protein
MGLNLLTVLGVLGLTVLTLLLTGPGMWSEKWGWRWFTQDDKRKDDKREEGQERVKADLPPGRQDQSPPGE